MLLAGGAGGGEGCDVSTSDGGEAVSAPREELALVKERHNELDVFRAHLLRAPHCLVFTGRNGLDYTHEQVAIWPAMKTELASKLRNERSAAVAFWDSNRVCWSSGWSQVTTFEAYARGWYMFREQLPLPLVYVAGPYSAKTREGVEENIRRAELLGLCVAELGAMPVIPHCNTSHPLFESAQPYDFWLRGTLELMRRCDVVILTSDWERSSGARGEREEAERIGLPVFESPEELKAWLEAGAPRGNSERNE